MLIDSTIISEKLNSLLEKQVEWEVLATSSLDQCLTLMHTELSEFMALIDHNNVPQYYKCLNLFILSLNKCSLRINELDKDVVCFFLFDALSSLLSYSSETISRGDDDVCYREKIVYVKTFMDLAMVSEEDYITPSAAVVEDPGLKIPFPDEDKTSILQPEKIEDNKISENKPTKVDDIKVCSSDTFLIFRQGGKSYALPVSCVTEIVQETDLNMLPGNNQHLLGVLNLRGRPVTVTRFLNENIDAKEGLKRHIIIVEYEGVKTGFIVDEVEEVAVFNFDEIKSTDSMFNGDISGEICSIVKHNGHNTFVLNLENLIFQEFSNHG